MADLYGTTNGRDSSALESEDMSSFLHNLLQNSAAAPPYASYKPRTTNDFSDHAAYLIKDNSAAHFAENSDPIRRNVSSNNDTDDFDFGCEVCVCSVCDCNIANYLTNFLL